MAARHRTIDRIKHAQRLDRGIRQVDQEQAGAVVRLRHDDADPGALGAGDEFLASVDDPVIAVEFARGLHHRRIGAGAAFVGRFGHEERRTRSSGHQRLQKARLLLGASDLAEQVHIALIGRHRVAGQRPQGREAGLYQGNRGLTLREMRSIGQNVRREHAGLARLVAQFLHEVVARPVRARPRILLVGDHFGADECLDLCGDGVGSCSHGCGYSGRLPPRRVLLFRSCARDRGAPRCRHPVR